VHQIELEMQNEELRRTQVELDVARARYFDLYDLAPVGYCTVSENGVILEANLTAATLLGMARGALIKQRLTRFILPEDQDSYYRYHKHLLEASESRGCELRLVKKDGAPFWVLLEAIVIQDADGTPKRRVTMSDITEQRMLHEKLAQHQRLQAVEQLAIGVMHNFDNLLLAASACIGMIDSAINKPHTKATGEVCRNGLSQLRQVVDSGRSLTRKLMAFCRTQPARLEVCDVYGVVADTTHLLKTVLGKRIALRVTRETATSQVLADRSHIEQVILNLALNSHDAMPDGGTLTITIAEASLGSEAAARNPDMLPGRYVLLSISDTGAGMDEATRERLFEPFFTSKTLGQGNGLGLAIVHGIIGQLHGHIEVHSQPGRGATFDVYLPASGSDAT
jgi:PAS domain S-box-containing protein